MSYGIFRLNRCYSGPKVLIISAEEHAHFIREETGWYIRDDFGDETPVFSEDEKPVYATSTKNDAASENLSACEQLQIEYGTVGRERGIAEEMAVSMFLQSRPPQGNCLLNPVPPMIRSVSF